MACIPGGGCPEQRMLNGSVGKLMAHQPGLRPPSPPSSPSTQHRALACLWNFPGGKLPQKPSLAPYAQYILSPVPSPLTPSSLGSSTEPPGALGPPLRGTAKQPRKETGPLVTHMYFSPLFTSSRHICDLSFSVVYCVEARPSSQLRAGPASHSPRRPSQPSPEQPPPAVPSAAPEPSRP